MVHCGAVLAAGEFHGAERLDWGVRFLSLVERCRLR